MSDPASPREEDEGEVLLPWYATSRLSPAEAELVRRRLGADASLRARVPLAEEERDETRALLEALPLPSARVRDDVLARIAALEGRSERTAAASTGGLLARIGAWMEGLGPRHLAWAAAAAVLVIVLQGGVLTAMLLSAPGGTYTTASDRTVEESRGSFALVSFAPGATLAQVTGFLAERGLSLADGPRSGGLYRVRLSAEPVSPAERERLIAELRKRSDIVAFAVASQ